ncbi:MAG: nuclear transport factor 2 family protein [Myxococcales bacterium]|nr:nuclear transport factor 2 family protein [Myxococcales bacterium]
MSDPAPHSPSAANKQRLAYAYAEAARGNTQPFWELLSENAAWSKIGSTAWSRTYTGISEIRAMLARLREQLDGPHVVLADHLIAEGNHVVVQAHGRATTKAGHAYNNTYCMVYQFAGGRIAHVQEYCDTALIDAVLT